LGKEESGVSGLRKIKVFDTTLRDGEQSPGATLSHQEKLLIAKQLEKLGVDVIEAGFPVASADDRKAISEIAGIIKKSSVCALARCMEKDIKSAAKALENAKKPRIHVFLATSPIHMKYKLKKTKQEIIEDAVQGVRLAKRYCPDVEFSPEDASRTKKDFLYEVAEKTIEAGAATINITDTVGYAQPQEFGELVKSIRENVPNIDEAVLSVHCHNDLGLAVSNSLEAVRNGAQQVECTVNGIGERAGNASLEEIAMALYTRKDFYRGFTGINFSEIYNSSRMVSSFTGLFLQRNKAVVGKNAFAHEAGIHQHGVLSRREAYEIMDPKLIGMHTELVIGKHSGRHAIESFLNSKGLIFRPEQVTAVVARVKELADKHKTVFNEDVLAIANEIGSRLTEKERRIKLKEIAVDTGNRMEPRANITLLIDGQLKTGTATGVGSIDAISKALKSAAGHFKLKEYRLKAITGGTDALADVFVTISCGGKEFFAEAVDEDIVVASIKALIKALNFASIPKRRKAG
jgi:2-isopropylmalate synthase